MNDPTIAPARPGLRGARRSRPARSSPRAPAFFRERGFDGVTVAEIADASNVSVKTLFTYFEIKEDLVFADENELRDQLIARVRDWSPGQSAFDAVAGFLTDLVLAAGRRPVLESLERFRRSVDSPAVQSRLRLMWERDEERWLRCSPPNRAPTTTPCRVVAAQSSPCSGCSAPKTSGPMCGRTR